MLIKFEVTLKDGILIDPTGPVDWPNTHFHVYTHNEHAAWGEIAKVGFKPSEVKYLRAVRYVG